MSHARLRAGMAGTGNTCEFHVAAVKKLAPDVELIGITDLDAARAQASAEKWGTTAYKDLDALVAAGANVIHVLTPPASHGKVAVAALERGCHVLIEPPITEDADEARKIGALAEQNQLTASVNHSLLYDRQVKRAQGAIADGALGQVVSVEILHGSEYPPYEGGPLPPWYRDAGYPFRELGVHCLYLLPALLGPIEGVDAQWSSTGGDPNLAFDEWRATVRCARGLGQFQLGYNTRPMRSQLVIHGTESILRVDLSAMFHGKHSHTPLPKVAERLVNAFVDSIGPMKFVRRQVQAYQGLRDLVAEFYRRLAAGEPPPVSVDAAAQVVQWVEKVARAADADHKARLAPFTLSEKVPFLVTGASGSLGKAVVKRLRVDGHRVRVFQRRIPDKPQDGIEYAFGNLGDPAAVDRAVKGAEIVIHCGTAMKGGWPEHKSGTVVGTQNVIDACKKYGAKQLVHISSMSVIDWAGSAGTGPVSETANLEPRPDERGAYTRAKLEAELLVAAAAARSPGSEAGPPGSMTRGGPGSEAGPPGSMTRGRPGSEAGPPGSMTRGQRLPAVILRPGQIFGGGIPLINGAVARDAGGRWLVLGDGKLELPLVYIDDVIDAIMASIAKQLTGGEVIQIIDPEHLTQEDVLGLAGGSKRILRVPRPVVFALGKLSEYPLGALGRTSPVALYRLKSALARLRYDSDRAAKMLDWHPRVGVREGIKRAHPVP